MERKKQVMARSLIYKLLSRGFLYPREPFLQELSSGDYQKSLTEAAQSTWGCIGEIKVDRELIKQLPIDYTYYFDVGEEQPLCAPYAGIYLDDARPHVLLHLSELYKNFGLAMAAEHNELQDYLPVELEFMHFLCYKEYQALEKEEPQLQGYCQAQKDFLQHHLLEWIPAFVSKVEKKCNNEFYPSLARCCKNFVVMDSQNI